MILLLVFASTVIGALSVAHRDDPRFARRTALLVLGTATIALVALWLTSERSGAPYQELTSGGAPWLELSGATARFALLPFIVAFAAVLAGPKAELSPRTVAAILVTAAGMALLPLARHLALIGLGWVMSALPAWWLCRSLPGERARSRVRKTAFSFLVLGAAPLLLGLALLGQLGASQGLAAPGDLVALATVKLPLATQEVLLFLFALSVGTRLAIFPLHSWLPVLLEEGPFGAAVLLTSVHSGLVVLTRVVFPLLTDASALAMPLLGGVALVSALFGALLASVQSDLRRVIAFLAVSQVGLIGFGIASMTPLGVGGASIESCGAGLALAGLLLLTWGLVARTGTADLDLLGGLVARAPAAALGFLVLALTAVGFPGGLAFVGEDLLIHGALEAHPLLASLMLLATALNAITALRTFTRAFLGRPRGRPRTAGPLPIEDLLPRERIAVLGLALLLLSSGLYPRVFTAEEADALEHAPLIHPEGLEGR